MGHVWLGFWKEDQNTGLIGNLTEYRLVSPLIGCYKLQSVYTDIGPPPFDMD
ncbi:hypothetical protein M408DRAFT_328972 [Serendipita vermifera MAFF 305830]|uniref:Uncharacterized protein n=1 Tax=Serendipita vermifera MAFF 305830 TaxID=933852 RepID=A0A0C2WT61_SERVB|nr:hypothetical protein M408DRAFT_328972 [Serendipita vermifera MAFF 305830]